MKPKAPCLNCEDRNPGCHSRCEKYISYKEDQIEYNKLKTKERFLNSVTKGNIYY